MAKAVKKAFIINDEPSSIIVADKGTKRRRKENSIERTSSTVKKWKKAKEEVLRSSDSQSHNEESSCSGVATNPKTVSLTLSPDENLEFSVGLYKMCLCEQNAVVPVDDNLLAFLLQDYDINCKTLKDDFEIVSRKRFRLPKVSSMLYTCTCNPTRKRMIDNLPVNLDVSLKTDFDSPYNECHHIKVMKQLVDEFDEQYNISGNCATFEGDHSYDKSSAKVNVYGIPSSDQVLCVTIEEEHHKSYTIVKIDFTGKKPSLKCSACRLADCKHCKAVFAETSEPSQQLLATLNRDMKWRTRYVPVSLSTTGIPFAVGTEVQYINQDITLQPSAEGFCECGSPWSTSLYQEDCENIKLYSRNNMINATVYRRQCTKSDCSARKEYDGAEDHILNMGSYLVTHSVLRSYLRQFLTEGSTMASFYKEWYWQQMDNGNHSFADEFSYNRFRYSWYSFLGLLNLDYREGFACPECGDEPDIVVMDGVSLGIRKIYMPWKNFLDSKASSTRLDGSSHNTRVFLNNQRARHLLTKYATTGISPAQFKELQTSLLLYQPCLMGLLDSFIEEGFVHKCPQMYSDFLKCLGSNYPVCALIHNYPAFLDLLRNLADGVNVTADPENIILIEQQCPVLSQLLNNINWEIPDCLKPVFSELLAKSQSPFVDRQVHDLPMCKDSCVCTGIGFFPNLPKTCHRGEYILDDLKKKNEEGCSKRSPDHKTLSPGLFTLSCVHGICYGFQLMEDVESPNIPFTILRTRFHTAPKIVVYDNACNLHNYALNRDPVFFQNTWFVVDRFHWCNHVGCHLGYCLNMYLQHRKLNTQVAEQRNATLKKLKSMLSYMNMDNFTSHLKIFFWFRSMISISSLLPSLPIANMTFFKQLSSVYSKFKFQN